MQPPSDERKQRIKALLRALLTHVHNATTGLIGGDWGLWAINRKADNTEEWRFFSHEDKQQVYYLDRPDLTKIYLEDLWVLPIVLDNFG